MILHYLKYSGIWLGFVFNPYHWHVDFKMICPDDVNPNQFGMFVAFGPIWIRTIIDNGK